MCGWRAGSGCGYGCGCGCSALISFLLIATTFMSRNWAQVVQAVVRMVDGGGCSQAIAVALGPFAYVVDAIGRELSIL